MATVQEIITFADTMYPNNGLETDQKTSFLNDIHTKIYIKIQRLKNAYKVFTDITVVDTDGRTVIMLPTDCKIDNIIDEGVKLSPDGNNFTSYTRAGLNDNVDCGNWFVDIGNNCIMLFDNGQVFAQNGWTVQVFYYPRPTPITGTSQTPDLDEDYHGVLKSKLIQFLASAGHDPDPSIANYWENEFKEELQQIEEDLSKKLNKTETRIQKIQQYYGGW